MLKVCRIIILGSLYTTITKDFESSSEIKNHRPDLETKQNQLISDFNQSSPSRQTNFKEERKRNSVILKLFQSAGTTSSGRSIKKFKFTDDKGQMYINTIKKILTLNKEYSLRSLKTPERFSKINLLPTSKLDYKISRSIV